jgi:Holliday junction resolvasome RuvABC endonuclease subunit
VKIIGLDLSITATGVALPDGRTRTIPGPHELGDERLYTTAATLHSMIEPYGRIDVAIIEDLPYHAMAAGITGMIQGVVRLLLIQEGIPYALAVPSTVKKYATGHGDADKIDMRAAMRQHTGRDLHDHNQVDAWWLRHAGLDWYGIPEVQLPATQRASLVKITWPTLADPLEAL